MDDWKQDHVGSAGLSCENSLGMIISRPEEELFSCFTVPSWAG
jgi:hypothetical protein